MGTLYQFKAKDIDGNEFDFASLQGKVVMITNVACQCGMTKSSYYAMSDMYKSFAGRPFEIVAFPSNQFGGQEPAAEPEIKRFVKDKFDVKFQMMAKSDVNGDATNPVYVWLKRCFPGRVTWNFSARFLIDHRGVPVARLEKESWAANEQMVEGLVQAAQAAMASVSSASSSSVSSASSPSSSSSSSAPSSDSASSSAPPPDPDPASASTAV